MAINTLQKMGSHFPLVGTRWGFGYDTTLSGVAWNELTRRQKDFVIFNVTHGGKEGPEWRTVGGSSGDNIFILRKGAVLPPPPKLPPPRAPGPKPPPKRPPGASPPALNPPVNKPPPLFPPKTPPPSVPKKPPAAPPAVALSAGPILAVILGLLSLASLRKR